MSFLTSNPIPKPQSFPFLLNPPLYSNNLYLPWKRRRLKRPKQRKLTPLLRCSLEPLPSTSSAPFDVLFSLLSANWIPPAVLAVATGVAISLSEKNSGDSKPAGVNDTRGVGEWILFTSPTPFNRFVLLRCPSIAFEGGELLENVSDKLVKEDRHYVRLNSGRIVVGSDAEEKAEVEVVEERESEVAVLDYQRVCVTTEDGGVISIDWPANLELSEERGLDTTVLIVPGTTEGSMEESVKEFVRECLKRGLFPVVMNPRGCAGSPLTSARLFTAADSDDICSAIQFITRARPWSTMTGVGWGFGANMLTKYLAEAGEKTPLTAATCIDNPFDLDEATKTSPYSSIIDKKLTGGLINILKANKELFQGRGKGFDVEKALGAESLRDFEAAISMVSHEFKSVDEFYANCSTRSVVGNLKIPVLFIQNDDGSVPLFSVPRALIAENSFTSLLLCSCLPSHVSAISWYQQVAIEWLTAVELGLLKGRHPLLQDIDVTINPSKGLALMEGRAYNTDDRLQRNVNLVDLDSSDAYLNSRKLAESDSGGTASFEVQPNLISIRNDGLNDHVSSGMNGISPQCDDSPEDNANNPVESNTGQVEQSAQVVMNMLDVTMPGTLKEAEKRKVLEAVGQGETIIKALQDAVPEDVRGKLTTSVAEIMQAQGKNLNLDGLLSINQIANVSSGFNSKVKDKVSKQAGTEHETTGPPSDNVTGHDNRNSTNKSDTDEFGGKDAGSRTLERSSNSPEIPEPNSVSGQSDEAALGKDSSDSKSNELKLDRDGYDQKVGQPSDIGEDMRETVAESSSSSQTAGSTDSLDAGVQSIRSQDDETKQEDSKYSNMSTHAKNPKDLPQEQSNSNSVAETPPVDTLEAPALPVTESQLLEKDDNSTANEKLVQPPPDQTRATDAKSTSFNVTQALDALTGLDDSTQIAVNSVFGVLEDMITQLEEKQNENADKKSAKKDGLNGSTVEENHVSSEPQLETGKFGEDQEGADNNVEPVSIVNNRNTDLVVGARNKDGHMNINKLPSNVTMDPLAEVFYQEYLRKHILSKSANAKPSDLNASTNLYLHYVPEEGHWILLEKPRGLHDAMSRRDRLNIADRRTDEDEIIEPSYVVLDKDKQGEPAEELKRKEDVDDKLMNDSNNLDTPTCPLKASLLESLTVEVSRRLDATDMKDLEADLAADMEKVVDAVYLALQHGEEQSDHASAGDDDVEKSTRINGNYVLEVITEAVQDTSCLKRVLPIGVIVGSSLAALRNFSGGATIDDCTDKLIELDNSHITGLKPKGLHQQQNIIDGPVDVLLHEPILEKNQRKEMESVASIYDEEKSQSTILNRDTLMAGAVTAALGASTLFSNQQDGFIENATSEAFSNLEENHVKNYSVKSEEDVDNKEQGNIVTSFAEKAMSVAAPVVPTREDGEVDHERIVTMLAEFGQRGGMLRLVGKLALLWGGLRGAMSLTDRLISFLRVAERPLLQRILGFSCMVLVLWSPVLLPLLPTLFHNMATHSSSKIVELACIVGLYTAVTILIMQWGKRIRGYEYPLKLYGLDLMSPRKVQDLSTGLAGGVALVLSIHAVNVLFGFVSLSLPSNLSSSSLDFISKLKAYCQLFLLAGRGLLMAAGVAFVEELLFRSWLLEEIAADLGYHLGIILSGVVFSLSQRSLHSVPGLWLLSVCLAGARLRKKGNLFIPIGLRTGIMSTSFLLQMGGFLIYHPSSQFWAVGMHPFQPFNGVVGLLFALLLAVFLYPRQLGLRGRIPRTIRA